jgi:hypothetical protein
VELLVSKVRGCESWAESGCLLETGREREEYGRNCGGACLFVLAAQ